MSIEIALRAARVRYGPLEALHGLDLPVPAGTVTVLLGRNGSGRTTALRALAGTVRLSAGTVVWRGADVTRLSAHERARRGLCLVPDLEAVYAGLTVAENLALTAPGAVSGTARGAVAPPYPELLPLLSRTAGTLSGGERRMLALSRALLAVRARVVLVDEPSLGLAPPVAARTYRGLAALAVEGGAAVVLAEQRVPEGLPPGSLVHELRRGSLAFSGEPAELS
ncbi:MULTISPECIES: ATP-binding cassette domain-containing protein [Streptomyces]|uniref:ATP-binding cassette domain-containing protein n=1 Tax=Streptomyces TaxID=1883 RepID=UPI00093D2E3B|nr:MULTISPECIES: ATP-binding cassette domain-containing protein [Streptomyces]MBX9426061.1 ATP-binding cassette domain-containing protein [Streptomyces lateritius]OKJ50590.1 ABC transporter [Streptomyces sp. CB02261]